MIKEYIPGLNFSLFRANDDEEEQLQNLLLIMLKKYT